MQPASKASTSTNTQVSTTAKPVVTYDKTIPKVIRTDPAYNAKVSTSKTIKITFSEKIKMGTGFIELRNSKGNIAIKTAINGNALYINPVKNLIAGNYVLYLHTGSVKDLAGNKCKVIRYQIQCSTHCKTFIIINICKVLSCNITLSIQQFHHKSTGKKNYR